MAPTNYLLTRERLSPYLLKYIPAAFIHFVACEFYIADDTDHVHVDITISDLARVFVTSDVKVFSDESDWTASVDGADFVVINVELNLWSKIGFCRDVKLSYIKYSSRGIE